MLRELFSELKQLFLNNYKFIMIAFGVVALLTLGYHVYPIFEYYSVIDVMMFIFMSLLVLLLNICIIVMGILICNAFYEEILADTQYPLLCRITSFIIGIGTSGFILYLMWSCIILDMINDFLL